MKIIDKHGMEIYVTDLNEAIGQAKIYSSYTVINENSAFLESRKEYWKDLLINSKSYPKKSSLDQIETASDKYYRTIQTLLMG